MEFGIEKYDMSIMKTGKQQMTEGKSRKNQNTWSNGNLQIRGNIGSGYHQVEMK